jgi:hypothetical protein
LLEKKRYYLIILTILLFVSIDISSYNYIALGKEEDNDDDDDENNAIEKENDDGKNGEDFSLNELFGNNDGDNDIKEIEKDKVPFILPFTAVPFP